MNGGENRMKESLSARLIQWFPGHMTKTLRLMEKDIRNVDAVLQLLDARIPRSSLNPEIARITAGKPHLYVLNKADLADPDVTARWVAYFRRGGDGCLAVTSKNRGGVQGVKNAIETELAELLERRAVKGMAGAKIRVMVVGIPNVGKSTFSNSFAGAARAKAADRPGVTRGKRLSKDFYVTYESSLAGALGTLYIFYDLTQRLTLRGQAGVKSGLDLIYTLKYD